MVNRSKPKWWKGSVRSYWYSVIGINAAVLLIAVSVFYLGVIERFPILTLVAIPILLFAFYSPGRTIRYVIFILIPAAVGYMTALFVFRSVLEINSISGVTLGFILGGIGGYLVARRTSTRETK